MVSTCTDAAPEFLDAAPASMAADDTQVELEAWALVPLTQEATKVALDAVGCEANYARTAPTRLCLHYVNSIHKRSTCTNATSFLYSVDGCESSQIVETGRCGVPCHQPSTYELQLTQIAAGSEIFIVQSIAKIAGRTLVGGRRDGNNMNLPTVVEGQQTANVESHDGAAAESLEQRAASDENVEILDSNESQAMGLSSRASNLTEFHSTETQQHSMQPLSYQAASSQTEKTESANAIAIVGIATVSVSTIAFVLAFAMVRWRARASTAKGPLSQADSSARATGNSSESSRAPTGTDSVAAVTNLDSEMTGFFI
jgi:hypothetical protein